MEDVGLTVDHFCLWVCQREREVVGYPGIWFNDPLSQWISERLGGVYGVSDERYGPASQEFYDWGWLSRWAKLFLLLTDRLGYRPMTGAEAFAVLSEIEQRYGYRAFC